METSTKKIYKGCNLDTAALVIVDMQYAFDKSFNKNTVAACVREVKSAKRRKALIVVVEFEGCNETHIDILRAIGSYPYWMTVEKYQNDGSQEIMQEIKDWCKKVPASMRICGVNTDWCVAETAQGFGKYTSIKKIHVVADACNTQSQSKRWAWKDFCEKVAKNKQPVHAVRVPNRFRKILNGRLN